MDHCFKQLPHIFVFGKKKSIKCNKVVPTTIIIHCVRNFILPVWENSRAYRMTEKTAVARLIANHNFRLRTMSHIFFHIPRFILRIKVLYNFRLRPIFAELQIC